jgi:hypothetical protein
MVPEVGRRAGVAGLITDEFDRGGGTMTITKDTGCFVCERPLVG